MYIVKKRKRTNVLKQQIKKGIYTALMFIGFFSCLNWGIEYLRTVDWFVPKTIEILNREVADSTSYDLDSLVPTGELPYVESGSEASGIKSKPPVTSIESKLKDTFGEEYQIAKAVMMAESRGNCEAVGDTHLARPSIGLFQISQIYHNYDTKTLMNPDENIRIAKEIRTRGGWERWTTYRTGAYLKYL